MSPGTDHDPQPDHGWDNRRLILASLAPRTTTRPARRGAAAADGTDDDTPAAPGLLTRGLRGIGHGLGAARRQFNKRVPPNRRAHTAVITTALLVVLLVALAGVRYLTTDVTAPSRATTAAVAPPPPPSTPLTPDTIITGATGEDFCPHDSNYSPVNNAFDGNLGTAWVCTRVKNQNGQLIKVDFHRQVTLTQIRVDGGFDSPPAMPDQWSKHRIVTKLEIYFPKELNRPPATIDTAGAKDWRGIPGGLNPPATVSKLLIRVAETTDPPQAATPTSETNAPSPADDTTTVAISDIQFIGSKT